MDLTHTRTALHGTAELLLAGPQYAESGTIRLRVVPGGIATVAAPDLRLEGVELVGAHGRHPLRGRYAEIAAAIGVTPRMLDDVYSGRADVHRRRSRSTPTRRPCALSSTRSPSATPPCARSPPTRSRCCGPSTSTSRSRSTEVNYGVSPGDAHLSEPYAYVGPWTPRTGAFWNQSFGAALPLSALGGADAVADFFREGARLAAAG